MRNNFNGIILLEMLTRMNSRSNIGSLEGKEEEKNLDTNADSISSDELQKKKRDKWKMKPVRLVERLYFRLESA